MHRIYLWQQCIKLIVCGNYMHRLYLNCFQKSHCIPLLSSHLLFMHVANCFSGCAVFTFKKSSLYDRHQYYINLPAGTKTEMGKKIQGRFHL